MRPAILLAALAGAATVVLGGAKGYEPPNAQAYDPRVVTELRSQVASLESALYLAQREFCPNLGVQQPVPPPAKKVRR